MGSGKDGKKKLWACVGLFGFILCREDDALQVLTDVCVFRLALLLGMHKAWQLPVLYLSYCVLWELHQRGGISSIAEKERAV